MSAGQDSHRPRPHLFSATVGYSQSSLTRSTLFIESRSPWRKARERRSKMKRRKKKALTVFTGHGIVSWDHQSGWSWQDGSTPSSRASLRGFGGVGVEWQHVPLLVNGTMEEHPALPEPWRPHRTPKVFHQHNTPSPHSPWSKKGFKQTRMCSRTPGERNRVCVCMGQFCLFKTV